MTPDRTERTESTEFDLRKNEPAQRYELTIGDEVAGYAEYRARGGAIELPHTVVEPKFRGRGLSKPLVQFALDDAAATHKRVIPTCSAVAGFIERNPQYRSLVAGE